MSSLIWSKLKSQYTLIIYHQTYPCRKWNVPSILIFNKLLFRVIIVNQRMMTERIRRETLTWIPIFIEITRRREGHLYKECKPFKLPVVKKAIHTFIASTENPDIMRERTNDQFAEDKTHRRIDWMAWKPGRSEIYKGQAAISTNHRVEID